MFKKNLNTILSCTSKSRQRNQRNSYSKIGLSQIDDVQMFSSQHNIHGQIQNVTLASASLCNKNKFYNHIKNKPKCKGASKLLASLPGLVGHFRLI